MTDAQREKKAKELHSIIVGTFGTELGQKCLEHLEETFIHRDMYKPGMTLDEVAFKQGEASFVKKLLNEIKRR